MKLNASIKGLNVALQKVTRAVSNHAGRLVTLVAADGVLSVHKTDGSSFARAMVPIAATGTFRMVVDGASLQSILATAVQADEVTIEVQAQSLRLVFGSAKIKLSKEEGEPMLLEAMQWDGANKSLKVDGAALQKSLKHVASAAARNHVSFYMNGVYFTSDNGKITLVGTNGFVLTKVQTEIAATSFKDTIVPINVVESLFGNLDKDDSVTILSFDEKGKPQGIGFRTDNFEVLCAAILGNYPNFAKVIPTLAPEEFGFASFSATDMVNALERIGMVSSFKRGQGVRLTLENSGINISESDGESVEGVSAKTAYAGIPLAIQFNPIQLAAAIKASNAEFIRMFVKQSGDAANSPICLTDDSDEPCWKTVAMPLHT